MLLQRERDMRQLKKLDKVERLVAGLVGIGIILVVVSIITALNLQIVGVALIFLGWITIIVSRNIPPSK